MKFILALLSLVLASSSFANDQQALSKLISSSYQAMSDDLAPGNYNSVVRVSYLFQTGGGSSETVPVLLIPETAVNVPFKMEDCSGNDESIACNLAAAVFKWYEMSQPANGQFQINLQLGVKVKEISFSIN